jgi:hypothetical protein
MRLNVSPESIANAVMMKASMDPRARVLVEGDSDEVVYRKLLSRQTCGLQVAVSKDNALKALRIVQTRPRHPEVGAIVDSDFWHLDRRRAHGPGVMVTDLHDLEMMLISSPAFDRFVSRPDGQRLLERLGLSDADELRARLLEAAGELGHLRWHSTRSGLWLTFKGLSYQDFFDPDTLQVDVDAMLRAVLHNSPKVICQRADLAREIGLLKGLCADPWHVACGHDATLMLALALGTMKSRKGPRVPATRGRVEDRLGEMYDPAEFVTTRLAEELRAWARECGLADVVRTPRPVAAVA